MNQNVKDSQFDDGPMRQQLADVSDSGTAAVDRFGVLADAIERTHKFRRRRYVRAGRRRRFRRIR